MSFFKDCVWDEVLVGFGIGLWLVNTMQGAVQIEVSLSLLLIKTMEENKGKEKKSAGWELGSADLWIFLRAVMKTQCDRGRNHHITQEML